MDSERAAMRNDRGNGLSFTEALQACLQPAVVTVNRDGVVTGFSSQAEKLTQLSAAQMINQTAQQLPKELRNIIHNILESGKGIDGQEVAVGEGLLRVNAFPSHTAGGAGVTMVLHDVGPMLGLEGQMRQLDRLASLGALSASMAHEIKNALVAVRTFIDVLVAENKGEDLAGIVSREMRRIDSIVSQMLRLAGPAKPSFGSLRLHSVLDHALHLVQHQVDAKKLVVEREPGAQSDVVRGDEYQLQQAFLNLFFNAIEAMNPGGKLTVRTETMAKLQSIRVSIGDTGVGIPGQNLGRVFDAFFTTKQQGTGLGLPITRRIVEEHKGTITVESEANKGSTFYVTLPV
jgi:two-component system, NtrC family, sensor histidine kinase HydH